MTLDDNDDGQGWRMRTKTPDVDGNDGQQGRMRTRTRDNNEGGQQGRTKT